MGKVRRLRHPLALQQRTWKSQARAPRVLGVCISFVRSMRVQPNRTKFPGTDVAASTLHSLFELDVDLKTKLDLSKVDHEKVKALVKMECLLLDEVSM